MSSTTIASTTAMKVEVLPVLTLLMLPEELILSCLVRVPRLYYPTLTLVSKSFRSLINSPELFIDGVSSSSVFVMDTHYHTWCKAPRGWGKLDYTNWMEVFDTKIRTWEFMPSLGSESFDYENMALEGSIYVRSNEKGETFKLNKVRWRAADLALTRGWSYNWKRKWREVKRLKGRLPMSSKNDHYRLADYGGNLVFLWEELVHILRMFKTKR
uniref:F-box domain-containing protein n=1 Tax=Brassica campestris TaxID=3711 RepID=M4DMA2_BRACM